jgi:hypothetical protein
MDSEKFKSLLEDYRITILAGVILGLILGLVIGWGIWPVQWKDLAAYHLRADLREDYLRMSILVSSLTSDTSIATKAWDELGQTANETLVAVQNNPQYLSTAQIAEFLEVVEAEEIDIPQPGETTTPSGGEGEDQEGGANWVLFGGMCVGVMIVAGIAVYFLVIRGRPSRDEEPEPLPTHRQSREAPPQGMDMGYEEEEPDYPPPQPLEQEPAEMPVQGGQQMPVGQFMTTYMFGDDLYDDSFSIDAPTGEFLGECGVGISDTVGVGEPKRVTAFEVWLFDKNDIQTVTKVVMSLHAFEDSKIRMRLESKGEPVLAEPGKQVLLETATLQLEARVVDMNYGEGAAPENSFFQRLTLELAIWPKDTFNY